LGVAGKEAAQEEENNYFEGERRSRKKAREKGK